ncbi:MAG TPA: long-chain fatty acid--CoA ligase [Vicinamibacterales bacterium]|nr:long-chain fatty acid--CoA ligase [Vicinamibacterales bacterium]
MAEPIAETPATIAVLPFFASGRFPTPDLLGRCREGGIDTISGRDLVERVRDLSLGLGAIGMARGDRVALVSESRPEWLLVDFAILSAGGVTVPIYPTLSAEQVAFILRDSESAFVVVSNAVQLAKVIAAAATLPALRGVVVIDAPGDGLPGAAGQAPIVTLADTVDRGHRRILDGWGVGREFHDEAKKVQPHDLATIIYTSGTTGEPKGVMLTHANLVANLEGVKKVLDLNPDDTALSFLPLCHAFERMVAYIYLACGVSMIFAESIDTIARDLKTVRPTVMTGVPRVFEKLHARVLAKGREPGGLKRVIFDWAVRVADSRGRLLPEHQRLPLRLKLESRLAERLVFRKIREGLGGRFRFAVSGSAALRPDIGRFFYGLGLPILEGYGLTETSPVLCVTPLRKVRFGTVGPPLPNVELRIAPDGEILARGPNVMSGYFHKPDQTADVIRDGWLHTGDIGAQGSDGYLAITDRKKELIVTSGGKKIAPQPIEASLRAHDLVAEAVLVGEKRHYVSALIVPDFQMLSERIAMARPADAAGARKMLDRPDVRSLYAQVVAGVNDRLAQFERIKKFELLAREFTVDAGELTPTLKVRRKVVEERLREVIETMYQSS